MALLLATVLLPACDRARSPGERVYRRRCRQCHGDDGRGRTKFAEGRPYADLTDGVWKHGPGAAAMRRLIAEGEPKSPMPPFEGRLSAEEIDAVVQYVQALVREARPSPGVRR